MIEGVPVQFLPAYNALVEEALGQAREIDYDGVPARVVRAEHLIAVALQTGRSKDRARVAMLREQASLDLNLLADILKRHQLEEKWKLWTE
jgi:predicted nucleotidyltransferase